MSEVVKPTPEQVAAILADHAKWLRGESGGKRANLRSADLYGANLSSANLRSADLYGANLSSANLRSADLYGADLRSADLRSADLRSADLYGADLRSADLRSADLRSADLYGANLRSADLYGANLSSADLRSADLSEVKNGMLALARTEILPREGEVIGWKKCDGNRIAKLRIPADAKRSNAPGGRKCRAERAEVIAIYADDGGERSEALSYHYPSFVYRVGAVAVADGWGADRHRECAPGIHFYLTREEAEAHC